MRTSLTPSSLLDSEQARLATSTNLPACSMKTWPYSSTCNNKQYITLHIEGGKLCADWQSTHHFPITSHTSQLTKESKLLATG